MKLKKLLVPALVIGGLAYWFSRKKTVEAEEPEPPVPMSFTITSPVEGMSFNYGGMMTIAWDSSGYGDYTIIVSHHIVGDSFGWTRDGEYPIVDGSVTIPVPYKSGYTNPKEFVPPYDMNFHLRVGNDSGDWFVIIVNNIHIV